MEQKGIAHILLLLILLAGIAIAVYLTQFTQVFKPKAAEPAGTAEYGSTPLAKLDKYPRSKSGGIQINAYFSFSKKSLQYPNQGLTPEKIQFLAKEMDYIWFDQGSLVLDVLTDSSYLYNNPPYNFTPVFDAVNQIKAINPLAKVGIHAGATPALSAFHIPYSYLSESDFVHNNEGNRIEAGNRPADPNGLFFINLQNPSTGSKIQNVWRDIFNKNPKIDGLNFDGFGSPHQNPVLKDGCKEGACNTKQFWLPHLTSLTAQLNAALPEAVDVTYNGLHYSNPPDPDGGPLYSNFVDYMDGALSEHVHRMIVSPEIFKGYIEGYKLVTDKGKKIFIWVQPQLLASTDPGFTYINDLNLERFYLASYLLIQKNPLTYFGYHPGRVYWGNDNLYFYKDWNMDYGQPKAEYANYKSSDMYYRVYSNGYAVVNSSDKPLPFEFPPNSAWKEWDPQTGNQVSGIVTIPPKSGKFYFASTEVLASPTPTAKQGDIDNDGDVDIFDFNSLISDFGKTNDPNTKADLDNDNDVDIFDYNLVVGNFGK